MSLDNIPSGVAAPEVIANSNFVAVDPIKLFAKHDSASGGLTLGIYGGNLMVGTTPTLLADVTLNLTASATNYVEATAAGVVSFNTAAFTAGRIQIGIAVTGTTTITTWTDKRTSGVGGGGGGGAGSVPTGTGFVHITGGSQDAAAVAVDLSTAHATGILAAARMPALTGDVTSSAGAVATTLANTAVAPATYGDSTHVGQFTVDAKGRLTSAVAVAIAGTGNSGLFGNGDDGAVLLDGTATVPWASKVGSVYTMTTSCGCTTLTVNAGVTLQTQNFVVYVNSTLTNNGSIQCNGVAATTSINVAGTGVPVGVFAASGDGTVGAGVAAPSAASNLTTTTGGSGGAGGTSPSGAGGAGGVASIPSVSLGGSVMIGTIVTAQSARVLATNIPGGCGGGGGRGDGGGSGGAAGAGGGVLCIFCQSLAGNGTISANGGAGSAPYAANTNGGGGGGGGGGIVYLATTTPSPGAVNTLSATGGVAGAGKGTGSAGTNGSAGKVYIFKLAA